MSVVLHQVRPGSRPMWATLLTPVDVGERLYDTTGGWEVCEATMTSTRRARFVVHAVAAGRLSIFDRTRPVSGDNPWQVRGEVNAAAREIADYLAATSPEGSL